MTEQELKARSIAEQSAIYVPFNCEGIRISHCEDDAFYGQGEESGDEYSISYDEVDFEKDMFYKLVLVEV